MEGHHIGVLVEQRHGGFAFTRWVEPGVEPHHFDLRLGVDRTHAQREGVDALQHFRDGETRHIPGHAGLCHAACSDACEVTALVIPRIGHGHVGRGFVAGDGLELHAGEVLRHFEGGLHVAKTGREDELVALLRQVADHAFGVCAFGHVFDIGGGDFAAQRRFDSLAAVLMLAYPACGGDGGDIHKPDLERWGDHRGL